MRIKLALIFLIFFCISPLHADSSACPLRGLKNVSVSVDVSATNSRTNLDSDSIKSMLEQHLTDSGLKAGSGEAKILIIVNTVDISNQDACAFSVRFELTEPTTLTRTGSTHVRVITWILVGTGVANYDSVTDDINDAVSKLSDRFLSDYKKDNPPLSHSSATIKPSNESL